MAFALRRIVVAIDQPYQGRVVLADGSVTEAREDQFADPMAMIHYYGADVSVVLGKVLRDPELRPLIDTTHIAIAGHSNGALAALAAERDDPRVTDVVALNAWDGVFERVFAPRRPLLVQRAPGDAAPTDHFLASNPSVVDPELSNSRHESVMDEGWLSATEEREIGAAAETVRLIARLVHAYLTDERPAQRFERLQELAGEHLSLRRRQGY